jgi:L-lactate dehydrogenase (cytochrome)
VRLALDGLTHPRWLGGTFLRTCLRHGMPHFQKNFATRGAPILSKSVLRDYSDRGHLHWDHWKRVRAMWKGTLVIKGVLDPRDAARARDLGADGVIVSNHGGRQLDGAVASLRVLPAIVAACPGLPVMLDGGVRRGTDVLKALSLGAACVFVGRPFGFAAAVAGEAGALHAIALLRSEIDRDMAMLGITGLGTLDPSSLVRVRGEPPA